MGRDAARVDAVRSSDRANRPVPVPESVVCVDLDSTLCDTRHRRYLVRAPDDPQPTDWREYSLACADDPPIDGPIALVRLLARAYKIVIVSARDEAARDLTVEWLRRHEVPYDRLILYRSGVDDADIVAFKATQIRRVRDDGAEVVLMVEDAPAVATALQALGVTTLLVQPPAVDGEATAGAPAR